MVPPKGLVNMRIFLHLMFTKPGLKPFNVHLQEIGLVKLGDEASKFQTILKTSFMDDSSEKSNNGSILKPFLHEFLYDSEPCKWSDGPVDGIQVQVMAAREGRNANKLYPKELAHGGVEEVPRSDHDHLVPRVSQHLQDMGTGFHS